ncbi:hypothetical protein AGMMS49959_15830 [Planctomycetales bacterium]|nr:hypothetical protein AGMMS49959_15740 [Planctomycetales bacterium]GHV23271.1 hypothetical protein AGMMS49959_15830 [Planctomycetales bacterium]
MRRKEFKVSPKSISVFQFLAEARGSGNLNIPEIKKFGRRVTLFNGHAFEGAVGGQRKEGFSPNNRSTKAGHFLNANPALKRVAIE